MSTPDTHRDRGARGAQRLPRAVAVAMFTILAACRDSTPIPDIEAALPGPSAERGLALVSFFKDSLPDHSGNDLRCVSCHLDNGTRPSAMPWSGSVARYPRFRARPGYEETMERRVNECIARSLAGRMLPEAGRDMQDIIAYLETMRDVPRPPAADSVTLVGRSADGAQGYGAQCARCHGANGDGTVLAPAVWGPGSYSIGAGMARQFMLATFLRHNMPYDHKSVLSDQEAADIAAYVLVQPRQDHPGKERDWPKGDPPPDAAYATRGATEAGLSLPPPRPLLPRRIPPDSL